MTRDHAFNLLRRVRDELDAARFALGRTLADWNASPSIVQAAVRSGITESDVRRCAANLEITFVLRLFSEFESVLRDYWQHGIGRATDPGMFELMESIARRHQMRDEDLVLAHQVREFRNDVIHDNPRDDRLDFPTCLRALGRYLRWVPLQW